MNDVFLEVVCAGVVVELVGIHGGAVEALDSVVGVRCGVALCIVCDVVVVESLEVVVGEDAVVHAGGSVP